MWNVQPIKIVALAIVVTTVAACAGENKHQPVEPAMELYVKADSLCKVGKPIEAIALLDSLDRNYKADVQVLRQGMILRTEAVAKRNAIMTQTTDSLIASLGETLNKVKGSFRIIRDPNLVENYRVHREEGELTGTAVQARIDENDDIYLATSLAGGNGYTRVQVTAGGETMTTDNAENYRVDNMEMVTFHGAKCDSLCDIITRHVAEPVKFSFVGKNTVSVNLSPATKRHIADTWLLVDTQKKLYQAMGQKMYLEKEAEINASQQARLKEKSVSK